MHYRWTHLALLVVLFVLEVPSVVRAQHKRLKIPVEISCTPSPDDDSPPPQFSVSELRFSGPVQLSLSEQEQIAASVKKATRGESTQDVAAETVERVRAAWQDRGYFEAYVDPDAITVTEAPEHQLSINVRVEEGTRYRLEAIAFKNNKAVENSNVLRNLFPIEDGDIFSRAKIATGLEKLRKLYAELGYVNFTSVPDTSIIQDGFLHLDVDLDEGKQFRLEDVKVLGSDEAIAKELLDNYPIKRGEIYNADLAGSFNVKYQSLLPPCICGYGRQLDEQAGTVTITIDFRACPTDK